MARPAEKARAMLNKWVKMREQGNAPAITPRQQKRPHLASECEHLADAEYYRNQIIREITAGISKIQDASLGEYTLRDINDDINKKMREKYHWNKRIQVLGGVDYNALERKRQIEEGDPLAGAAGNTYRYFGSARELPGVKEILAKQAVKAVKKRDLWKHVTPDYFGWRDEEDGVLVELEQQAVVLEQSSSNDKKRRREEEELLLAQDYLDVPTPAQVEQVLLEQKKKAMLAKFSI
ncbi:splicing factor ISY1 homolog [Seminavis robusta]|uniref:Splicing factor ISY1 homolog n=1 Tax=Seminavis robusta TaxID=568900 RepID=A0A9N8EYP8_9STRA|nr:splicing factor ISY1 homolog [Seminavis robusta]|eukprot:Sro2445_g327900.1 splicing factor ISY1 homolog (236) ;mRNA; f:5568-6275